MGKRPAEVESFVGNMGLHTTGVRPSMQREEPPAMATGLERIAVLIGCKSTSDERSAGKPHATIRGSRGRVTVPGDPVCALKAHGIPSPEMATAAKPSSQPRTESCVVVR